jgi:hypothetical protein
LAHLAVWCRVIGSPSGRLKRLIVEYRLNATNLDLSDWIGGPTYFLPTQATNSDFATLGLGIDVKIPGDMFVNFDYQTAINAFDTRSHMFQLKAGKKF